jgi:hypothetical protein
MSNRPLHRPAGHACDAQCRGANGADTACVCECAGANHGIDHRRANVSTPESQARTWARLPVAPSDNPADWF